MSEIIETVPSAVPVVGGNIAVSATQPEEMRQSNAALMRWCQHKLRECRAEIEDLTQELEIATRNKWRASGFKRQLDKARKRIVYYGKIFQALKAGYCIIPNFPIEGFLIRTNRTHVKQKETSHWNWTMFLQQDAMALTKGEGTYKNPFPVARQREEKEADGRIKKIVWADDWKDVEFPIAMAKPNIMLATEAAVKLNLFDVFGICPPRRRADPMIIAQIIDPTSTKWNRQVVSFLIAWHLDTSVL